MHIPPFDSSTGVPVPSAAHLDGAQVHFVVQSPQSAYAVEACLELLQHANSFSQREYYESYVHETISEAFLHGADNSRKTVILFGNINESWPLDEHVEKLLRIQLPCAARVGLVGGAAMIASKLRYLRPRVISVHPNMTIAASENCIKVSSDDAPTARDGRVYSAIGGLAALKMIASMISDDLGSFLSDRVMSYVGLEATGIARRSERENWYIQRSHAHPLLVEAISIMAANIESPLTSRELAKMLKVSSRQLERRFQNQCQESPMSVYKKLRLERADQLLRYSDISLIEVSIASGFGSVSGLSQNYRVQFGCSPSAARAHRYSSRWDNGL